MTAASRILSVIAAVLAFGALRLPLERGLDGARRAAGLRHDAGLSLSFREQMSQASLVAVLGGLRSLVAALWDLWAAYAWENTDYAQVEKDYRFCQLLQPRIFYYWDRGQWMMATMGALFYRNDYADRGAMGSLLYEAFVEKGLQMVKDGQRFLPDEVRLYEAEAYIYRERVRPRPFELEAEAWRAARNCPGAPAYTHRFYAYALAQLPEREEEAERLLTELYRAQPSPAPSTLIALLEVFHWSRLAEEWSTEQTAYSHLRRIYDASPVFHIPRLISTLKKLEARLGIPPWKSIPVSAGR